MRKIHIFLVFILCFFLVGCQQEEPKKSMVRRPYTAYELKKMGAKESSATSASSVNPKETTQTNNNAIKQTETQTEKTSKTSEENIKNIKYTIEEIVDVSLGDIIREKVYVYATIPLNRDLNTSEIHDLLIRIVNEYTYKKKINSLAIILSDDKRDIGLGYSLGFCEFDSYGKTENAMNVKSGDYTTFVYKTTSLNRIPYENERPTNEELDIYYYYSNIRSERLKKGLLTDEEEDEIENKVANKFGISKDLSNEIIDKVYHYKSGFDSEYKTINWKDIN